MNASIDERVEKIEAAQEQLGKDVAAVKAAAEEAGKATDEVIGEVKASIEAMKSEQEELNDKVDDEIAVYYAYGEIKEDITGGFAQESTMALDSLVDLLNENPNVTIELAAHCDYHIPLA